MNNYEQTQRVEAYCIKLCNSLKEKRISLKLTQEEISDKAGISLSTIRRMENCKHVPDLQTLLRIGCVLNEEYDDLDIDGKLSLTMHSIVDFDINQLFRISDFVNACIKMKTDKDNNSQSAEE